MAVNLTNAEIRQFELAGITREMIGRTIERDRAAGLPDNEIELRAAAKAENLEKANPSLEYGRGVSRWISNLPFGDSINRGIQGLNAAYDASLDYLSGNNKPTVRQYLEAPEGTTPPDRSWREMFNENYDKNIKKLERTYQEQNYDVPKWYRYPMDAAGTIGSYGLMPAKSIPTEMAIYGADAFQQGYDKDFKDRAHSGVLGASFVGALGTAGAFGNKVRIAREAAKEKKAINTIKNDLSETLGKVLEKPRTQFVQEGDNLALKMNFDHQNNILGQMINNGPKDANTGKRFLSYSDQETLVRKMPKIVKANKETGKIFKQAAEENMSKKYLDLVTENLDNEADMLIHGKGIPEADRLAGEQMKVISDQLKKRKNLDNIDDLFTKSVTDAEEGLTSINTDKVIDYLDDFVTKLNNSKEIPEAVKERIINNMFNTGMERRLAKRIHYIDEADMAKKVGGSKALDILTGFGKDALAGIGGGALDVALGGTGAIGGILGALGREGIGLTRGISRANTKRRIQQRSVQQGLDLIKKKDQLNKLTKETLKTGDSRKLENVLRTTQPKIFSPSIRDALERPLPTVPKIGIGLMNHGY
ncbi:MAG: hypothetical protein J6T10_29855 [Methanobrevibacter sp.]|nr:hypothetical protein [Methanobrevibacter sp.]